MAGPISWQLATVTAIRDETPTVRSFTLGVPAWAGHRPGQHVDLRLTAADGYSVERSYSIASEPERARRDRDHGRAHRRRRGLALPP